MIRAIVVDELPSALPVSEWVFAHSDAWHPGSRDQCSHCQLMIATLGPMPPAQDIRDEFTRANREQVERERQARRPTVRIVVEG